ncbi:MAG: 30S ribosomal protein S10 [Victivallaceae bacterium]|nr:30S ribosomal protein S10 [Victivallaceae bacterium]
MATKTVQKFRIRLQSYDAVMLDQAVAEILNAARTSGSQVVGPIPLPTRIERWTVNRSPHTDKKSMEQFEIRTHKRVLDIINPSNKTIDELKKLNLSAGVGINIKAGA